MTFKIGFTAEKSENKEIVQRAEGATGRGVPKRSVVQVRFPQRGMTLAYYNDSFDLNEGDLVYVDGKLEGLMGSVVQVNYNFKIKVSDYKRVISVVDRAAHGEFYMAGSHLVTFDPVALPADKAATWFKVPASEDEEYASGSDDSAFVLDDLSGMGVTGEIFDRGRDYYCRNKVKYICLDGSRGHAIVEGSHVYDVEFECFGREIRSLTCSCFCGYNCKHEVTAMMQLRETLEIIHENYSRQLEQSGYFAAVSKEAFFTFAVDGKKNGKLVL